MASPAGRGDWLVIDVGRFPPVAVCTLLLVVHIHSCSCVLLAGAVWNDTKECCWGRPPLGGYLLQGERVISHLEAASTLH